MFDHVDKTRQDTMRKEKEKETHKVSARQLRRLRGDVRLLGRPAMRGGPSHTSSLACADWLVDDSVVPSTGFETATTSTMGDVALHRSLRRFLVCWLPLCDALSSAL
jgi:hypothetical protein